MKTSVSHSRRSSFLQRTAPTTPSSSGMRVVGTVLSWCVALVLLATSVAGHVRLECPPPLSGMTGEKRGPCDVGSDDGSMQAFSLQPNALNTITWLESISHPGAPVRFALSREGGGKNENLDESSTGFETCLLLDHVPHDALSKPKFGDQSTWHRSSITLFIPDVRCERCYLQLISVMSDVFHGVPGDTKCAYKGALDNDETLGDYPACPAVYHSCAPVSIDGTIPRNDIEMCNTTDFEETLGWPLTQKTNPELYEHSIYYNRGDVGLYTTSDARLKAVGSPLTDAMCTSSKYCDPSESFQEILGVPETAAYTSLVGSCASFTASKVEAYTRPQTTTTSSSTTTETISVADGDLEEIVVSSSSSSSITPSTTCATTAALTLMSLVLLER